MLRRTAWIACLLAVGHAQAQTAGLVHGEYWIDQDLGIGANTAFTLDNTSQVADLQLPISLSGYGPGVHTIGIRTLDADGRWSLTNFSTAVVIEVPVAPPDDLVETEYFLNEDPGFGNGPTAWTGSTTNAAGVMFNPDLSSAVAGINTLFLRSRSSNGVWSLTNQCAIVVIEPEEVADIVRIETFALPGPDPGFGMADQHSVSAPDTDLVYAFDAPVPQDFVAYDTLMVRAMDANGSWSLTNQVVVEINQSVDDLKATWGISAYPNPFTEGITVRTDDELPVRVVLYDPQGKLVHDRVLIGETRISLQGHANGTYTAFFWKEAERIHRVQLVKQ